MSKKHARFFKQSLKNPSLLMIGQYLLMLMFSSSLFANQAEINSLDEAMEFVFSEQRVPNANEVKLKELHATYTDDMKVWKFTFIHGPNTHIATVDKLKRFKLESSVDIKAYNETFWADRPRAEGMFKKDWLYEAENVIESYKFELTTPTILNFKVCEPPKGDTKSEYANGCKEESYKETWSIVRGVKERKLAKMVVYVDGQLDSFSNVTVELTGK